MLDEKRRVEIHAKEAGYAKGVMSYTTAYSGEIFTRYMIPGSVLELGPAEGVMTDILYPKFADYTIVDGADFLSMPLRRNTLKLKRIKVYLSIFIQIFCTKISF